LKELHKNWLYCVSGFVESIEGSKERLLLSKRKPIFSIWNGFITGAAGSVLKNPK